MKNFERLNWGQYLPEAGSLNTVTAMPKQQSLVVLTVVNYSSDSGDRYESKQTTYCGLHFKYMHFSSGRAGKKIMLL